MAHPKTRDDLQRALDTSLKQKARAAKQLRAEANQLLNLALLLEDREASDPELSRRLQACAAKIFDVVDQELLALPGRKPGQQEPD